MTVEFLFGPEDGLEMHVGEECYQVRFPMREGAAAILAWASGEGPSGCFVYERDPGSAVFVYAGVS